MTGDDYFSVGSASVRSQPITPHPSMGGGEGGGFAGNGDAKSLSLALQVTQDSLNSCMRFSSCSDISLGMLTPKTM